MIPCYFATPQTLHERLRNLYFAKPNQSSSPVWFCKKNRPEKFHKIHRKAPFEFFKKVSPTQLLESCQFCESFGMNYFHYIRTWDECWISSVPNLCKSVEIVVNVKFFLARLYISAVYNISCIMKIMKITRTAYNLLRLSKSFLKKYFALVRPF